MPETVTRNFRRPLELVLWSAAIAAVTALQVQQALVTPVFFDEPLWYMRSQVSPADFSRPEYRFWAIDIPSVNRWVWYAALKATGLDVVPPGERRIWRMDENGALYFGTGKVSDTVKFTGTLEDWEKEHGSYAPRGAVIVMRMTNLAAYAAMLAGLWFVAKMALESGRLAVLAIAPIMIIPLFAGRMAFESSSGDIYCLAAMSWGLAAWMFFHLRGQGASWTAVAAVGVLCGLATASKHIGVMAFASYAAYVAVNARGMSRALKPIAVAAAAFIVFVLIDPLVIMDVKAMPDMLERRFHNVAGIVAGKGALAWTEYYEKVLFWWPILPVVLYAAWQSRKERWFAPAALWGGVLVAGTVAGIWYTKFLTAHYLAPIELGLYFPAALMLVAAVQKAYREKATDAQSGA